MPKRILQGVVGGSGRMRLTGPYSSPTLTGGVTANRGALYFADLVTKDVVDLDDPEFRDLLDQRFQRMLQRELADRISTQREVVTRELASLARKGIIEKTRGGLVLVQPARLQDMISEALCK